MKNIVFFYFFLIVTASYSQTYLQKSSAFYDANLSQGFLCDINNDDKKEYLFLKNDSLFSISVSGDSVEFQNIILPNSAELAIADVDKNNFLDLVYSEGSELGFYKNDNGTFSEKVVIQDSLHLNKLYVRDIDFNGEFEFIGMNNDQIYLYNNFGDIVETFDAAANNFWLEDYNSDGNPDVIALLKFSAETIVFTHKDRLNFAAYDTLINIEGLTLFDIDGSGKNDIISWDKNFSIALKTDSVNYFIDSLKFTNIKRIDPYDLNSDGKSDFTIFGTRNSTSGLTFLLSDSSEFYVESILDDVDGIVNYRLGDFEADGDLDLILTLIKNDTSWIQFYENLTETKNDGPTLASNAAAFPTLNGVYLFFDSAYDDHTPGASLTYDLLCGKSESEILIPSDFNSESKYRLINRTGNLGLGGEVYLPDLEPGFYNYTIQGIDNALHSGNSVCSGSFYQCDELEMKEIVICRGAKILLQGKEGTIGRWFSAQQRNLIGGPEPEYLFNAVSSDTIYYGHSNANICSDYSIWKITVIDPQETDLINDLYACIGEELSFDFSTVDSLQYFSTDSSFYGIERAFIYPLTSESDSIFFNFYINGCSLKDSISIRASKPDIDVANDHITISNGETAFLQAFGASYYEWNPKNDLSDPYSSKTNASPSFTTLYTVTGFDSLNCTDTAYVNVEVKQSALIPSLFTPNDDGQNDNLKVMGLRGSDSFDFIIYDRSGKIIYRTQSETEAVFSGWDGTLNGSDQPAGVYFWKITGTYADGQPVLLNGKSKGEIVLIR